MNAPITAKTILVVDDDPDFLLQLQLQLKAAGFNVISANGLNEATEMLTKHSPDLVVADLMMEHMDAGFVLCHRVKKQNPKTPVIMITAVTNETGLEFETTTPESRDWIKADAILAKPVRAEQLRREVNRLLNNQ